MLNVPADQRSAHDLHRDGAHQAVLAFRVLVGGIAANIHHIACILEYQLTAPCCTALLSPRLHRHQHTTAMSMTASARASPASPRSSIHRHRHNNLVASLGATSQSWRSPPNLQQHSPACCAPSHLTAHQQPTCAASHSPHCMLLTHDCVPPTHIASSPCPGSVAAGRLHSAPLGGLARPSGVGAQAAGCGGNRRCRRAGMAAVNLSVRRHG
jgi:hypothetical protein